MINQEWTEDLDDKQIASLEELTDMYAKIAVLNRNSELSLLNLQYTIEELLSDRELWNIYLEEVIEDRIFKAETNQ